MDDRQSDFGPLASYSFEGLEPGPRLIVLGAVHGDEVCGTSALRRIIQEIETGSLDIRSGRLTCVPITNKNAHRRATREGDRNLNRDLRPVPVPTCYEDKVANVLCPLLQMHDVLIDLHSFSSHGKPFVFVGPENNEGPLQPFQRASEELQLARSLGLDRMVYGWLDAFASFVTQQNVFLDKLTNDACAAQRMFARSACGTTEYMRAIGGYGVTVECGNHKDLNAVEVAHEVVERALAHLGMIRERGFTTLPFHDCVEVKDIYLREHLEDHLAKEWETFSPLCQGELLASGPNGYTLRAPSDGYVIFAHPAAKLGEDWIHFGIASSRGLKAEV